MKINVLMGVYNDEKYLEKAIDSILNQTHNDFDFIIVDDGSTDNSREIIKKYIHNDKRVRGIFKLYNTGLTKSLNVGLEYCNEKYIARMDANDIALPDRFEKQIKFLEENSDHAVVGTWRIEYWEDGRERKVKTPVTHNEIINTLVRSPCLGHSTSMIRGDVLRKFKYDENFYYSQDQILWANIAREYKLANYPEFLMYISRFSGSVTDRKKKFKDVLRQMKIKCILYKNIKCPWWHFIHIFNPIIIALIPKKIMESYVNKKKNVEFKK